MKKILVVCLFTTLLMLSCLSNAVLAAPRADLSVFPPYALATPQNDYWVTHDLTFVGDSGSWYLIEEFHDYAPVSTFYNVDGDFWFWENQRYFGDFEEGVIDVHYKVYLQDGYNSFSKASDLLNTVHVEVEKIN
ncbi:MAG: hypothetical protein VR72_07500 [Clostridiaceae bacterium BRH_c20a]|nr:MAG: hypothetical protein VR72_07500 [Clostridiaceae bacterium BRH_c20a]